MQYSLSPSTLNLYNECRKCFWLQFNRNIKRPDGIFPSLPSGMDKVLKIHFDGYASQNKLPPEINHLEGVSVFDDINLLRVWRNNFSGIRYKDESGNILRGAVDAILKKDGKLIVLDYKTRGYPLKEDTHHHYINQLSFYNFLLRKNGYETEDYSYLLFYHPDSVIETVFKFNADLVKVETDVEKAEQLFNDALDLLKGPMPASSDDCQFCKYRSQNFSTSLLDY